MKRDSRSVQEPRRKSPTTRAWRSDLTLDFFNKYQFFKRYSLRFYANDTPKRVVRFAGSDFRIDAGRSTFRRSFRRLNVDPRDQYWFSSIATNQPAPVMRESAERYPDLVRRNSTRSILKQLRLTGNLDLVPQRKRKNLRSVLESRPTAAQLAIPARAARNGPLSEKALRIFGDEGLRARSRRIVPQSARITPKVLKTLGYEAELLPNKAALFFGAHDHHSTTPKSYGSSLVSRAACLGSRSSSSASSSTSLDSKPSKKHNGKRYLILT